MQVQANSSYLLIQPKKRSYIIKKLLRGLSGPSPGKRGKEFLKVSVF
jgi:hypothetical protein